MTRLSLSESIPKKSRTIKGKLLYFTYPASDRGEQFLGFRIQYEITGGAVGCSSAPCQNGGDCIDLGPDEFLCFCTDGFTGDRCEIGNNPCDEGPCRNGKDLSFIPV